MGAVKAPLGLFEGFGPELEYMLVNSRGLFWAPVAPDMLRKLGAGRNWSVKLGSFTACNEFVEHVVELNATRPLASLENLHKGALAALNQLHEAAARQGSILLPTGMHPWMRPHQARFWTRHNQSVYAAYRRLFKCKVHGFANVQSAQLNLPFDSDESFFRLHTAIRLILPLLPALAASTPYREGRHRGLLDERLAAYRHNQDNLPQATGGLVPEALRTRHDYQRRVLAPLQKELNKKSYTQSLNAQWVNSRAVIARFDRMALEIRVLDLQECAGADFAIQALIVELLKTLVYHPSVSTPLEVQASFSSEYLSSLLIKAETQAHTLQLPSTYAAVFGFRGRQPVSAINLWRELAQRMPTRALAPWQPWLKPILRQGPLAVRLLKAGGARPSRRTLRRLYETLADGLVKDRSFMP